MKEIPGKGLYQQTLVRCQFVFVNYLCLLTIDQFSFFIRHNSILKSINLKPIESRASLLLWVLSQTLSAITGT